MCSFFTCVAGGVEILRVQAVNNMVSIQKMKNPFQFHKHSTPGCVIFIGCAVGSSLKTVGPKVGAQAMEKFHSQPSEVLPQRKRHFD